MKVGWLDTSIRPFYKTHNQQPLSLNFMLDQDNIAKWVTDLNAKSVADVKKTQFIEAARRVWPRNVAYARREMTNQHIDAIDASTVAAEIWEAALRSVWKTFCTDENNEIHIRNLSSYLTGAFQHRFNRYLRQARYREAMLELLPTEKLIVLQTPDDSSQGSVARIHHKIQLEQVYAMLDNNIRWVLVARCHGFAWQEIAKALNTDKQNLIMRVQYAIRKIREKCQITAS